MLKYYIQHFIIHRGKRVRRKSSSDVRIFKLPGKPPMFIGAPQPTRNWKATPKLTMCGPSYVFLFDTIYDRVKRLTKRMTSRRGLLVGRVSRGFTAHRE